MNEPIISVRNLHRAFEDLEAVTDLSFDVTRGQVVGFIGANGAGKTTTMRIMATLDQPTAGSVFISGFDVVHERQQARDRVGWMPDSYGSYQDMTVWEYLDFFARTYRYSGAEREERVAEVMEFANLLDLANREMDSLSKGMSQRLCLGRMLIADPEVLILDEPAAGLDPQARVEFKHLVRILAEEGKTLFISSHILSELEDMCDSILFINDGQMLHHGSAEALKVHEGSSSLLEIKVLGEVERLAEWCQFQKGAELVEQIRGGYRVLLEQGEPDDLKEFLRRMVRDDIPVIEFVQVKRRLEEAFVDMLRDLRTGGIEPEEE